MTNPPVLLPLGFRSCTANMGLKTATTEGRAHDFALVVSEVPAVSAAVFTKSRFAGPSVVLSRADAAAQASRGIVVVSGVLGRSTRRNGNGVCSLVFRFLEPETVEVECRSHADWIPDPATERVGSSTCV